MKNPFDLIDARLSSIETLILGLQNQSKEVEQREVIEQFLSVQEAAQFLNLSVPTIYSKVSKGELPVMKRGKRLYFSSKELMAYLKDGRKKSFAEIEADAEAYLSNSKKGGQNGN